MNCKYAEEARLTESMRSPVRCAHCGRIYDLGKVEITGRYVDCSMWRAPCCGRLVDDRGGTWKTLNDYYPLKRRKEKSR